MINAFTIDVEDYYSIVRRDWLDGEGPPAEAVVRNTSRILELLDEHGVTATFFILGEVAEAFPQLLRDIAASGHEIGVHGYYHRHERMIIVPPGGAREQPARRNVEFGSSLIPPSR